MDTKYILEIWNPKTKHYEAIWEGTQRYAFVMFNKSYNARHTRRLKRVTTEVLAKKKGSEYL